LRSRRVTTADVTPDMNVTPLVDVVLVLLIIFMVVAPRLEQDVQIELPAVFNADPDVKAASNPLKVTVAKHGEYHIDQQQYDLDGAIGYLSEVHAADPYRRLVLRADSHLTYGNVREIFNRAQKVGFPGIALMVGERRKPGAPQTEAAAGAGDPPAENAPAATAPAEPAPADAPPPNPASQGG
jgi:biopolymer transport protein ExbD/biopolymer transport protein TolR